jgi:hypothetical protein
VVVAKDPVAFATRYGAIENVVGPFSGNLDNAGERIVLEGSMREPIQDFSFNNAWYSVTDGLGFSLVPNEQAAGIGNRSGWRASANIGGSPGQNDPTVNRAIVLVNEVLTHTDAPQVDAVEIYNPGASAVDIGNWYLTDDRATPKKFKIPAPKAVQPNSYVVFDENDFNKDPLATTSFALSSDGDEIYLYSADENGNLTGYSDGFAFRAAANGATFGRHVSSDRDVQYPAQVSATLGGANSGPAIGPVVINEIRCSPFSFEPEFIELKNLTSQEVKLYDTERPTNTWRLNGFNFAFPTNVAIPANGFVVIAQNDPARFRATNNVPASVQVFGPANGILQGNGENLRLERPDAPITLPDGSTKIPMITVDEVRYDQNTPWPTPIPGASIERNYSAQYGNDPANWSGAIGATPGFDNRAAEGWQTWLQQVFTPAELGDPVVSDPDADPDQDGYTNEAEFVAGTNPKNATSGLLLAPAKAAPATLEFAAAPDRTYTLYYRPLVGDGAWTAVSVSRASSAARTVQITPTQPGYYKIAVP